MKRLRPGVNRRDLLRLRSGLRPGAQSRFAAGPNRGGAGRSPGNGVVFRDPLGRLDAGGSQPRLRRTRSDRKLEAQMTVYRDDSEISELNRTAYQAPVRVERRLFALLESAVELSRQTGGAYDVTSGALSEAWGFVKGPKRVPDPAALAQARESHRLAASAARPCRT